MADHLVAGAVERLAWTVGVVGVLIAAALFFVGYQLKRHFERDRQA
jgi:hypothetical protein